MRSFSSPNDLLLKGIQALTFELENDCCELDIQKAYQFSKKNNCDGIIAAGGGKVLEIIDEKGVEFLSMD